MADAGDVASAPSAAQGEQLRTELSGWAQHTVDNSRDAEYLAKTDRNLLQQQHFDMDHVLAGEINAAFKNRQMLTTQKWSGTSPSGIEIEGFINPGRTTFYPTR